MSAIRPCRPDEKSQILQIINSAAAAYRGVIPADRWHEPYMSETDLDHELESGVLFWGYEDGAELIGVMGVQPVRDVDLIRHAYVRPGQQQRGIGGELLTHLRAASSRPMLVGTWADASWAIRFYQRHGFELVPQAAVPPLLRAYWSVPDRQIETSVVLANPPLGADAQRA